MKVHAFPKGINLNVNLKAQLAFELVNLDAAVQTLGITPQGLHPDDVNLEITSLLHLLSFLYNIYI